MDFHSSAVGLTHGNNVSTLNVMSGGSGHSLIVDTLTTTGQVLVIPGLTVNIMCHCMHMQINTHVGNTETH